LLGTDQPTITKESTRSANSANHKVKSQEANELVESIWANINLKFQHVQAASNQHNSCARMDHSTQLGS